MLNMGYTNHKSFNSGGGIPEGNARGECQGGMPGGNAMGKAMGEKRRHVGTHIQPNKVHTV